ncbi:MAG: nucleotide-binding protein [Leptospira sp.]|nr:nucleotide-binding protein [Leptospira sp.]
MQLIPTDYYKWRFVSWANLPAGHGNKAFDIYLQAFLKSKNEYVADKELFTEELNIGRQAGLYLMKSMTVDEILLEQRNKMIGRAKVRILSGEFTIGSKFQKQFSLEDLSEKSTEVDSMAIKILTVLHSMMKLDPYHFKFIPFDIDSFLDFYDINPDSFAYHLQLLLSDNKIETTTSPTSSALISGSFIITNMGIEYLQKTESRSIIKDNNMKQGNKIFIGHGKSKTWKELQEFLEKRLKLEIEEYNNEPRAGKSIKEVLEEMLENSKFAFLVMTGEDVDKNNNIHARENVIHEIGLFQGRLGFQKAIILLEEGCVEFSNIHGLNQIRFKKDDIVGKSEEIREILKREGIIS